MPDTDAYRTSERIYGIPGSERLYSEVAEAYETQIDGQVDEDDNTPRVIEEWTVAPSISHVRSASSIVEDLIEDAAADAPEDMYDSISHLDTDPDVLAAAEALREAFASRITYSVADKMVAEHVITWDDKNEPLVDGEPMYVPSHSGAERPS